MRKKKIIKKLNLSFLCLLLIAFCTACGLNKQSGEVVVENYDPMVDWKDPTVDPRGVFPEASTATGKTNPQIVETKYETEEVVIADIIPTEMGYAVDPTGKTDSTDGIQAALYDCYAAGGGTVYLPAGNYAVTGTIYVPSYVTLRGEWQDPDKGTEYGTVISVWSDSEDSISKGTFDMSGCSGVVGMTVYYPFQSLYEVLPYPYAFYVPQGTDGRVITLKDITIINGYRGIGTQVELNHESLLIENIKGTFLHTGFGLNNQSDVGHVEDVTISSKYWMEAAADYMNKPSEYGIKTYMKANTTGLAITDLEWTKFSNITVDGCANGISIKKGYRMLFVGTMIDINITDCTNSIYQEAADSRWGTPIARSNFEGDIVNVSKALLRTTDTTHEGEIKELEKGTVEFSKDDLSSYKIKYNATYKKPEAKLLVADVKSDITTDASAAIQTALNEMAKQGGGVVYVPGGNYRLDKPIKVPAGVELRGASSIANREQLSFPAGTLFLCYYGDDANVNPDTDQALVTLDGDYAGISGVRFIYPENGVHDTDLKSTYTIRGNGKGVYAVNCFIMASGYGIDFRNCDNHYIANIYSCVWFNTFRIGGKDGVIRNCQHNGNMVTRTNAEGLPEDWPTEAFMSDLITEPIIRPNVQHLIVDKAENQQIIGVFAYAVHEFIINKDSENTLAINVGTDWMAEDGVQLTQNGGSMTVINCMRCHGKSYECTDGKLAMYNRVTIDDKTEKNEIVEK